MPCRRLPPPGLHPSDPYRLQCRGAVTALMEACSGVQSLIVLVFAEVIMLERNSLAAAFFKRRRKVNFLPGLIRNVSESTVVLPEVEATSSSGLSVEMLETSFSSRLFFVLLVVGLMLMLSLLVTLATAAAEVSVSLRGGVIFNELDLGAVIEIM